MDKQKWRILEGVVIVPCHAVWNLFDDPSVDKSWSLQAFQSGEPPYYIEHVRRAIESAYFDPRALIIFSGGQTNAQAGPRSESQGYWLIADRLGLWPNDDVRSRSTTEEYATDSYQNILFSVCRFRECANRYPAWIKVYGWKFKQSRFADRHRAAIRFPSERFEYVGVNDPLDLESARRGESENIENWAANPYGTDEFLGEKRNQRNPWSRHYPYVTSCPELAGLLMHRGPSLFAGELPWDTNE